MTDSSSDRPHAANSSTAKDFIRAMIQEDVASGKHGGRVVTRFPPEPNGYLHIGHAKSICLNFGIAREFPGAVCHLRFDDTNPETESPEYVESIQRDVRWLGFDWGERMFFASDYFERLYQHALDLIEKGLAYVDSSTEEEIREYRGTVTEAGRESPYRERSVEENLDLFRRMRAGEFENGAHVLRAKIDMAHPNMKMRDPLLYRIKKAHHYRSGDAWPIYPMYDFAHCLSDEAEGITHSLCTLEFENNRDIYDWVIDHCETTYRPEQTEFARLNLSYTILSKRKLLELVNEGRVEGWNDPRMPTLSGLRRRGYTPEAIREFCDRIGVAKANSVVDVAQLEHAIRDDLNPEVHRVLCVLRPLKVVIENYPEGQVEELEAPYFPHDVPKEGSRKLPFSRELYIEREDFLEDPPKKFFRLAPGREVRLRYGYIIRCVDVVKDEAGEVVELRCTYDPETRGGEAPDGRKVKGTIHWVSAAHARPVEVRLYDRLFQDEKPDQGKAGPDYRESLNPHSLEVLDGCLIEPSVADAAPGSRFQFERQGYFYLEPESSTPERPVYNRIVALKDGWKGAGRAAASAAGKADPAAPDKTQDKTQGKTQGKTQAQAGSPPPLGDEARRVFEGYRDELGLPEGEARVLANEDEAVRAFFEEAARQSGHPKATAGWVVHELLRELKQRSLDSLPFGPTELAALVRLQEEKNLPSTAAKKVFAELLARGGAPSEIVERLGLQGLGEAEVAAIVEAVVAEHPDEVARFRAGQEKLFGFFVGQAMRRTRGAADPELVNRLLRQALAG